MKLEFIKTYRGWGGDIFEKGQIVEYRPWEFEWQEMTEPERVAKGIFVHCYGMGEFDAFRPSEVRPI